MPNASRKPSSPAVPVASATTRPAASLGTGQFRPLTGADPHIGRVGVLETVEELKVELVCEDDLIHQAVAALKLAHPYEEPAFDAWKLESL